MNLRGDVKIQDLPTVTNLSSLYLMSMSVCEFKNDTCILIISIISPSEIFWKPSYIVNLKLHCFCLSV